MSGSFESVRCVHRLDLSLYSHHYSHHEDLGGGGGGGGIYGSQNPW